MSWLTLSEIKNSKAENQAGCPLDLVNGGKIEWAQ